MADTSTTTVLFDSSNPPKLADIYAAYPPEHELAYEEHFYTEKPRKVPAFLYLQTVSKMYSGLKVYAKDIANAGGAKKFVVSTDRGILHKMTTDEPSFYEAIERNMPVSLGLDLDLHMLESEDPTPRLRNIFGKLNTFLKNRLHRPNSMSHWSICASGYDHEKGKYGFHGKRRDFHFPDILDHRDLMVAADIQDEAVDASIYKTGVLRMALNSKSGQDRPLRPIQFDGSYKHPDGATDYDIVMSEKLTNVEGSELIQLPQSLRSLKKERCAKDPKYIDLPVIGKVDAGLDVPEIDAIEHLLCLLHPDRCNKYPFWNEVCYSLLDCRNGCNDEQLRRVWHQWSAQCSKYEPTRAEHEWQKCANYRRDPEAGESTITVSSLFGWAKHDSPNRYRTYMFEVYRPRSTTRPLTLNTDLFHDRCDVEYYPDEYVAPYPVEDYWMIGEKARMGAGKTTKEIEALKDLTRKYNRPLSAVALTPRRMLARSFTEEMNKNGFDFVNYEDKPWNADLREVEMLTCQMESLRRLEGRDPVDVLLFDEGVSGLKQLSSTETMKDSFGCADVLKRLITTATHVLVLDAHLDNKTVDFMCNMAEESGRSKPLVRVNTSTPPPKKAFEIKSDKPHLRGQKAAYIAKLIQQLKAGKNVYLVTASKGFGEDVMRAVAKACPEIPEEQTRFYHADEGDDVLDEVCDVEEVWSKLRLLVTSPVITVGVSFIILWFHCLFIWGSAHSCTSRDIIQASLRVRLFVDNEVYFSLNTYSATAGKTWFEGVSEDIKANKSDICHLYFERQIAAIVRDDTLSAEEKTAKTARLYEGGFVEACPPWLLKVHTHNLVEDNLNKAVYDPIFRFFLATIGVVETELLVVPVGESAEDKKQVEFSYERLQAEPDHINTQREFETQSRKSKKSKQLKAQLAKYAFDHVLIENRDGPAADSFDFMRLNAVNRRIFMNVRSEFMSSPSAEARRLLHRSNLAEIVSTAPMVLDAMKRLVKALGLRNSIDDDQLITQQYMDRHYDTIMAAARHVKAKMQLSKVATKSKAEKTSAQNTTSGRGRPRMGALTDLLKPIFRQWNGGSFSAESTRKTSTKQTSNYRVRFTKDMEIVPSLIQVFTSPPEVVDFVDDLDMQMQNLQL